MGNTCNCCNPTKHENALILEKYENHEHYTAGDFYINPNLLANHDLSHDDYQPIDEEDLADLDRYHQFDYRFPFYKMNVNGFIFHVKTAANKMREGAENEKQFYQIDEVSLTKI